LSSRSDEVLRRLFAAARMARADELVPSFEQVVARRRAPRRARRLLPVAAMAAGLVLAVTVALPLHRAHREREALAFTRELAAWRAPSDRLLEAHGQFERQAALFRGLGEPSVLEATNEMVRWR
jgi:hypothetical protein